MRKTIRNVLLSITAATILLLIRSGVVIYVDDTAANALGNFVQILGTLYGIMAAFIVYVVWERYNNITEISEKETDSLSELYALITYLENDKLNKTIKNAIKKYAKAVIVRGWKKLERGEKSKKADEALHEIYTIIKNIKSDRKRFPVIFGQIVAKYESVSDLRTQRVTMSAEHLPKSLRILIVFDSIALIVSLILIPVTNFFVSQFIVLVTTATVVLSLQVIFDLDKPLAPGEWQLTPQAYEELIKELDERG